jgi:SAM-dependent methyltransferase
MYSGSFDYIVMCELLEHLDCPAEILRRAYSLLIPGGHCFITTCANAPAIDHVYLYHSVEHMRRELRSSGFAIETELALPVGDSPEERWEADKVEINYAAMLRKE